MRSGEEKRSVAKHIALGFVALIAIISLTLVAMFVRPSNNSKTIISDLDPDALLRIREQVLNYNDHYYLLDPPDAESLIARELLTESVRDSSAVRIIDPDDEWEIAAPDSPFPEEARAEVRAMKRIGLYCLLAEGLPLFDDFRMPTAEGNAYVRQKVQRRADEMSSWLDGQETSDEIGALIWGRDWSGDTESRRDWCISDNNVQA